MRHFTKLLFLASLGAATASCGDVVRDSRAPVLLVLDRLEGSSGPEGKPSTILLSDVLTKGSITNDPGTATFRLVLKDIGTPLVATQPSTNNSVTLTRYRVSYRRADGRNTQGVDVPWAFDGAATVTVGVNATSAVGFQLVRHVAKMEAPLVQLATNPTVLTTIADVTFYGQDIVGNAVSATGSIQVDFGNFADPE